MLLKLVITMHLDVHSHFLHLDFIKHLAGRSSLPRSVEEAGEWFVDCTPAYRVPAGPRITDMPTKLEELEVMDVDMSVLSHGIPGPEVLPRDEADYWASRINDHLAGLIEANSGRFLGWASVGFGTAERSIAEIDRCVDQLGFKGIQIFSNIGGRLIDSAEFWPVYRHMADIGLPMNLHPTIPLNIVGMDRRNLVSGLGFMYDTSLATMRLIDAGLFDELPHLKFIMPHVGGILPYIRGRLERQREDQPTKVSDSFDRLYFDTVTYNFDALEYCYRWIGAERLLYGTDHPFTAPTRFIADFVEQLDCTPEQRELIFHGNAERLLGIE